MLSRFALNRFGDGSNHSERKSTWLQSVVRKLLLRQHQSVVVRRLLLRLLQSVVVRRLLQRLPQRSAVRRLLLRLPQSVVVRRRLLSNLAPELQKKPGCICAGLFSFSFLVPFLFELSAQLLGQVGKDRRKTLLLLGRKLIDESGANA